MFLCDIGNTSYHFLQEDEEYKKSVKTFDPQTITAKIYYICVNPEVKKVLKNLENWIDLSSYIDMQNYYETMGIDRIVACEALDDGVIIDAGSAITVDVVSARVFQGGFIYPGVKAMGETYANISSVLEYDFNYEVDLKTLPKNSQDAISYAYLKLLHTEVVSKNQKIYLTGGDAEKLLQLFPSAELYSQLIFDGMKKIIKKMKV